MTSSEREGRPRRGPGRRDRAAKARGAADARGGRPPLGIRLVNLLLLAAAAASIIAGYVLLDRGSITAAPMLLVLGYAVLIPAGLLVGSGRRQS